MRTLLLAALALASSASTVREKSDSGSRSKASSSRHERQIVSNQPYQNEERGSSSQQTDTHDERDIFTHRLHQHALVYPHGPDPNLQQYHFRYDDTAHMFDNFQNPGEERDNAEGQDMSESSSFQGLAEGENFDYNSEDEARYYDEGLEPMEEYAPLWDPNYYSIFDINTRQHFVQGQIDYENQLIDPLSDDVAAQLEQKEALQEALDYGDLDRHQLRELRRGERNQDMRTQALHHISVLQPDNIGSYTGCVYIPSQNMVAYNSNLNPREVERRFHNHGKSYPHMPTLQHSEQSGSFRFKPRRLRTRIRREHNRVE